MNTWECNSNDPACTRDNTCKECREDSAWILRRIYGLTGRPIFTFVNPNPTHRWFHAQHEFSGYYFDGTLFSPEFETWVRGLLPGAHPAYAAFGAPCFVLERPIPAKYYSADLEFTTKEINEAIAEMIRLAPSPSWISECRRITEERDTEWVKAYMKGSYDTNPT